MKPEEFKVIEERLAKAKRLHEEHEAINGLLAGKKEHEVLIAFSYDQVPYMCLSRHAWERKVTLDLSTPELREAFQMLFGARLKQLERELAEI